MTRMGVAWRLPPGVAEPPVVNVFDASAATVEFLEAECKPYWEMVSVSKSSIFDFACSQMATISSSQRDWALVATIRAAFKAWAESVMAGVNVHAGCIARGDSGIAISGTRGAGKTTLIMAACAARGLSLIANDQCVLFDSCDQLYAVGSPSLTGIRDARLVGELHRANVRELSSYDTPGLPRSYVFSPSQVGIPRRAYVELAAFVQIEPPGSGSFVSSPMRGKEWVDSALLPVNESYGIDYMLSLGLKNPPSEANARSTAERLASIPQFERSYRVNAELTSSAPGKAVLDWIDSMALAL